MRVWGPCSFTNYTHHYVRLKHCRFGTRRSQNANSKIFAIRGGANTPYVQLDLPSAISEQSTVFKSTRRAQLCASLLLARSYVHLPPVV